MNQDLYDLPEGWELTVWQQVVDVKNGKDYKAVQDDNGRYPVYGSGGIMAYASEYLCNENSVVIGRKGTINNPLFVKEKFWNIDTAFGLEAKQDQLIPLYLYYFCLSFNFITLNTSTTLPSLTKSNLLGISIPLPPLAEQTRIVEKLDAVLSRIDTAIDELQQSLALVDAMFKSGLDGVFEDIYAHSAIKKLSELTTKIGSGATSKGGGSAYKESGISLIRSLNVHDLNFKYDGLAFIDDEQAKALSNVEVSSGDVLLNITGASIARCCIVPDGILPARVNQHVCILRPNHLLNSDFLNYLIVSPKFKSALLFQGAGGATRQALTKAMIENFDIPMPTLNKQAEAIKKIKQINEQTTQLKTEITAKIDLFNQLKASVLDGAFRGEV